MSARAWEAILASWSAMNETIGATLPHGMVKTRQEMASLLVELRAHLFEQLAFLITRLRSILNEASRQKLGLTGESVQARSPKPDALEARMLFAHGTDDEVQQIIEPLTIYLDERVLGRLPPRLSPLWMRMQEEVIHSDDGGAVFYSKLDKLLDTPHASWLVLEVYLFCLCEGFFGRYVDEPEQVQSYKDRIARRLPAPSFVPTSRPDGVGPSESMSLLTVGTSRMWHPAMYYAVAAVIAVVAIYLIRTLGAG